jgi:hypothetical protein
VLDDPVPLGGCSQSERFVGVHVGYNAGMLQVLGIVVAAVIACACIVALTVRLLPRDNAPIRFRMLDILLIVALCAAVFGILSAMRAKMDQERPPHYPFMDEDK